MKKKDIKKLLAQMTIEEKAGLLSGLDGWHTKPVERLDIPSIMMADGPHGLRKQRLGDDVGLGNSYEATCFPTASLLACSWDKELAAKQGQAIGEEASDQDLQIVLGPGNNIKRSPLCGRNFEYFSEDPCLSGNIAAGIINGIQSEGIGTTLKHFAANSQEANRLVIDERISERALREIYLRSFEIPVKEAKPTSLMCAYNKINGDYCSQSKWLLTDILRKEWGFKGIVMSDWGAVDNRPQGVYAGLDLEIPSSFGINDKEIVKAYKGKKTSMKSRDKHFDNTLSEKEIDACCERMLKLIFSQNEKRNVRKCDYKAHHEIAADIAKECMVLLKNDKLLPLKEGSKVAVIGEMAKKPRFQGSGSSQVTVSTVSKPLDEIKKYAEVEYAQGYSLDDDKDTSKIAKAVKTAKNKDAVIIIAGLPDSYESEGFDRSHMNIPESHLRLIEKVSKVNKNVVVVLCNGSPVAMPFVNDVSAILEAYLGGQAGAKAMAEILFGKANPCGKLAETFPMKIEDTPSYLDRWGNEKTVNYGEGIFVGYRWYEKRKLPVLFPFGHGLSYTTFKYSDLEISTDEADENDIITVKVKVKNTGKYDGKEIVQLYVEDLSDNVMRPVKELKAFEKIMLLKGEEKTIEFTLDRRAFAYWDDIHHDWCVNSGTFRIHVGASSADIRLTGEIKINAEPKQKKITIYSTFRDLRMHKNGEAAAEEILRIFGKSKEEVYSDDEKDNITSLDWCILRNFITMFGMKLSISKLQKILDKVNEE